MTTMKCIGCDTPIPQGATNCPMCGAKVMDATISPPPEPPKPATISQSDADEHLHNHGDSKTNIRNLIYCKECGNEISKKAEICPKCGAKVKRRSIGCGGLLLIFFVLGILGSFLSTKGNSPSISITANENWIEIATWDSRHVYYDKNSVKTINPDEKEVVYCVVTDESCIVKQVRINRKNNQSAIGWNEGRKNNVKVSEFDYSRFGWVYSEIAPNSAESILVSILWSNSR